MLHVKDVNWVPRFVR